MNKNKIEFGVSSMVTPLVSVALRKPGNEMLNADIKKWHYANELIPTKVLSQYQSFVDLLEKSGAEILWFNDNDDGLSDSVFTYDPSLVTPKGVILMNPGKILRKNEVSLHKSFYDAHDISIIGSIIAPGSAEAGDLFWLNDYTLAVGRGYRTNQAGIDQLTKILNSQKIKVVQFDLPVYHGRAACLHLMSVVSLLAEKVALVYAPLMPVALYQLMQKMKFTLLEAPTDEFESSGGLNLNVLATAQMKVIAVDGFPKTHKLMRDAGCDLKVFDGDEICIPCEGGPTCMTRPILRK